GSTPSRSACERSSGDGRSDREREDEGRARPGRFVEEQSAAMALGDALRDRQAEADPESGIAAFANDADLEDRIDFLRRNSGTAISNGDDELGVLDAKVDPDGTALGAMLDGVVEHRAERSRHALTLDVDG